MASGAAYGSTPEMTTTAMPFQLLFRRKMRTKLPDLRREAPITSEEVRDRDWAKKLSQKSMSMLGDTPHKIKKKLGIKCS